MYVIWKFRVDVGETTISLPVGAEFLDVQMQGGSITLWYGVHPESSALGRKIVVVGTGLNMKVRPHGEYLGTVQQNEFVWHVFDVGHACK